MKLLFLFLLFKTHIACIYIYIYILYIFLINSAWPQKLTRWTKSLGSSTFGEKNCNKWDMDYNRLLLVLVAIIIISKSPIPPVMAFFFCFYWLGSGGRDSQLDSSGPIVPFDSTVSYGPHWILSDVSVALGLSDLNPGRQSWNSASSKTWCGSRGGRWANVHESGSVPTAIVPDEQPSPMGPNWLG